MHLDLTITDANKDRAARISQARPDSRITVLFGWNEGDGMRLAPGRSSRGYATEKRARRAAQKWVADTATTKRARPTEPEPDDDDHITWGPMGPPWL